jgi:hypothetical protein
LKARIIVFFLIVTQCFLVGCNLRNQTQQRPTEDPFSTQEPFASPTRGDTERDREGNTESGRRDTERNRDGINERDRNDTERNRDGINERDREDSNTERERGGERSRRKRVHCNSFVNQVGVCQTHGINLQAPVANKSYQNIFT